MVKVNLHGRMGKEFGENWELQVNSVHEALRAIEANTLGKFRKWILDRGQENLEYAILINKKPLDFHEKLTVENIQNTEIYANYGKNLTSIDIIPVIKGGSAVIRIITIIVGVALIAAAFFAGPAAPFLALAGLTLVAAGVTSLLAKPPPLIPYSAQQATTATQGAVGQGGGPQSYLFNGPINTVGEGGPIPIGYGTLMIGSVAVNVYYQNIYVANIREIILNTGSSLFGLDSVYGRQFYFNENNLLTSQRSSYLNPV